GLAAMVTGKSGSQDTAIRRAGLVFPGRSPHDRRVLLTNARVYSMAESVPAARSSPDTLLIQDGRIVFCGRRSEVNPPAAEPTLDLGGRAVLPGLVDGHGHLMQLARARLTLDVSGPASEDAIAVRVGQAAARLPKGQWLGGRGWDQNRWPDMRMPTRASLDRAAPDHPVALVRIDGHATWVNSAALAASGITRDTRDPAGGIVVRDAHGEPSGLLVDTAQRLVHAVQPPPDEARFDAAVRDAIGECLAKGLTGIHEMGADLRALASYRRLIERGHFPFRNYVAVAGRDETAWERYRERGPEVIGDGQVVVGALKLMADGARGFQVCVLAIGDRANTLVLDTFERVLREHPAARALRLRVEHAQILAEGDI